MRIYEIIDEENNASVGILLYYEKEKTFICELKDGLDEWTAPFLFAGFVKRGIYTMPRDESLNWVRSRIIPPSRQNIDFILKTHKLKEYDENVFLEISRGICSQDSLYVKPIKELPQYVLDRQMRNLSSVMRLSGQGMLCVFNDGSVRKIVRLIRHSLLMSGLRFFSFTYPAAFVRSGSFSTCLFCAPQAAASSNA